MPLGAFRLNGIARFTVTAVAEVIRKKMNFIAEGDAQVDTTVFKIGRGSLQLSGTGRLKSYDPARLAVGTGDITIETWIYRTSTATTQTIYDQRDTSQGFWPAIFYDNGNIKLWWNGAYRLTNSATINTNTWYHVALVRNAGDWKIFVDGTGSGTYTGADSIVANDDATIGMNFNNLTLFAGYMDEFRISNTARYTSNFTPSTTPFVNDENTLVLLHMDGTDGATDFPDDVGVRQANGVVLEGGALLDTTDVKFGTHSFNGESTATTTVAKSSYDIAFGTSDFTMEAWVYITADFSTTATGIFNTGTSISDASDIRLGVGASPNNFTVRLGTTNYLNSPTIWSLNTWYHVALTRNNGTVNMWINGTKDTTIGSSGNITFTQDCAARQIGIGRITYAGVRCMPGNIDEVRISSVARYTSNFTAPTAPFVNDSDTLMLIHWDQNSAGSIDFYAYDDVGVRAPVGVTALGNAQVDTAESKFGGASALFDGSGDYLATNPLKIPSTGDFTIEFWHRPANTAERFDLVCTNSTSNGRLFTNTTTANQFQAFIGSTSGNVLLTSTATYSANNWYHYAFVRSGNNFYLYVDGTLEASDTTGVSRTIVQTDLLIGTRPGTPTDAVKGHLDEIRISNIARYTATFTPSTTPFQNDSNTLLLLHMDGTDGSTVFIDDNGVTPDWEY